jgi:hypothetical protein
MQKIHEKIEIITKFLIIVLTFLFMNEPPGTASCVDMTKKTTIIKATGVPNL